MGITNEFNIKLMKIVKLTATRSLLLWLNPIRETIGWAIDRRMIFPMKIVALLMTA